MKTIVTVLLAVAALANPGPAATHDGEDWRAHCGADVDRLCADAESKAKCLHEHWDEVSQDCKDFKEKMAARNKDGEGKERVGPTADWKSYCGDDVERLCAGSDKPGMCLHEHWDEVSTKCKDFKEKMAHQKGGKDGEDPSPDWKAHCGDGMSRLCADAENKGACTREHRDEVSAGCKEYKEKIKGSVGSKKAEGGETKGKMRFEWSDKKKEAEKTGGE